MSHFALWVLLPKSILATPGNIEAAITTLLAPYDENIRVPSYKKPCYCIGHKAGMRSIEKTEQRFGAMDDTRRDYWKRSDIASLQEITTRLHHLGRKLTKEEAKEYGAADEAMDKIWKDIIKDRIAFQDATLASDPEKEKADPECDECNGTGLDVSTYNPESKWDWYRVGGRWDGAIKGRERPSKDNGFNFGKEHEEIRHNLRLVSEMPLGDTEAMMEICPFAFLSPDGEWHERGKMGWFGMVAEEKDRDDWQKQVEAFLRKHVDCVAICVDCHI